MNLLFVSIAFPPKSDPECLQAAKYYKYLKEERLLKVEVVTSKVPTLFMPVDESLRSFDFGFSNKVEVPVYETKITNFFLRKVVPEGIDWPDSKFTFHLQSEKIIKLLKFKPDIIYSRSYPLSSTILAFKLHKYFQVPWILHLSDPWSISPIHNYTLKQSRYHSTLEHECFNAAYKICLTSEKLIENYKKKYKQFEDKFEYFPNVYDKEDISDNIFSWGNKLRIIYTGGLAGARGPDAFFKALLHLETQVINLEEKLEIIFAGPTDRENKKKIDAFQSRVGYFKHVGVLSYTQCLELQKEAHILLVIDNPIKHPHDAVFFPSKILDYLLAKRKIIAITTPGGTTNLVLNSLRGDVYSFENCEGLVNGLLLALKAYERKDLKYFLVEEISPVFEASFNVERLKKLFI